MRFTRSFRSLAASLGWMLGLAAILWYSILFVGAKVQYRVALWVVHGELNDYGQIELPDHITSEQVVSFEVLLIPPRTIHIWPLSVPVGPVLETSFVWRDAHGVSHTLEKMYAIACDSEGWCQSVHTLRDVAVFAPNADGAYLEIARASLKFVPIPYQNPHPLQSPRLASPEIPPPASKSFGPQIAHIVPRLLIAGGAYSFYT